MIGTAERLVDATATLLAWLTLFARWMAAEIWLVHLNKLSRINFYLKLCMVNKCKLHLSTGEGFLMSAKARKGLFTLLH